MAKIFNFVHGSLHMCAAKFTPFGAWILSRGGSSTVCLALILLNCQWWVLSDNVTMHFWSYATTTPKVLLLVHQWPCILGVFLVFLAPCFAETILGWPGPPACLAAICRVFFWVSRGSCSVVSELCQATSFLQLGVACLHFGWFVGIPKQEEERNSGGRQGKLRTEHSWHRLRNEKWLNKSSGQEV